MDRLRAKMDTETTPGCWRFTGKHNNAGYGSIKFRGKSAYPHIIAYQEFIGPIPNGLELDHLCRIRDCFNPDHLEAVTHLVNMRRGRWRE